MSNSNLYEDIVKFVLQQTDLIATSRARILLVQIPLSDNPIFNEIDYEGSPWEFVNRLVTKLLQASQLEQSGEKPIITFLDSLKYHVGVEKQEQIEILKTEVKKALADNTFSFKRDKGKVMQQENGRAILGTPQNNEQFQCDIFMVMPFREHLNPIYTDHIKPTIESLGLEIKRGDDPFSEHDIITEIWSLINNSRIVISDCTGKNPNVFYEMGLAHAIGKPVIPITQDENDIPFDIRQRRYIKYEYTPRGMHKFEDELKNAVQNLLGSD